MENKDIFTSMQALETQMGKVHGDLSRLMLEVKTLVEENQRLREYVQVPSDMPNMHGKRPMQDFRGCVMPCSECPP